MELVIDKALDFLEAVKNAKGTNAKKEILGSDLGIGNDIVGSILYNTFNPYIAFNVVKVPKTKEAERFPIDPDESWYLFFSNAEKCANREVTGNAAVELIQSTFNKCSVLQEKWMRKILKKHLAIGISTKTINKVVPNFIPTFDVSLAQKYDFKRIKTEVVGIEPKLDGIRCVAIVQNSEANLYARSGKQISNFDNTVGKDLSKLPDGVYDGEIMSKDFTALMRQVYRKEKVNTKGTYLALFDFLPLNEWISKSSSTPTNVRYDMLIANLTGALPESIGMASHKSKFDNLKIVKRNYVIADEKVIKDQHDRYVNQGYEGAMIKDPSAPYYFKRDWAVMKCKDFFDADVVVKACLEGTGKHAGKLGSFVVDYKGVDVQVGSGLSDELREKIWKNKGKFIDQMIEVRYQEVTPDGSLRFPTFVCFRNDR
jgi:DNA ligase 1